MKAHYINILLFAPPLNILVSSPQKNPSIIPRHTQNNRSLCECELYMSNYDNDPEMKRVMQKFHDRTTQRFQEYDERLQEKQQICKDKCDKEIQKIILKDKIEKELNEKFAILQTDIHSDAIPTCICEKSMADKVEKMCLKCGGVLGGGVAPELGLIGGTTLYAICVWKPKAIAAAIEAARKSGKAAGIAAGKTAGIKELIQELSNMYSLELLGHEPLDKVITSATLKDHTTLVTALEIQYKTTCLPYPDAPGALCFIPEDKYANIIKGTTQLLVGKANKTVESVTADVTTKTTATLTTKNTTAVDAAVSSYTTAIIASIVAVLVIVLVMVIIYLILRYRRKRKMKKKLQYIKLLEE
ncbi:hypothetical protein PFFCH_01579 [Plasmodium falciparum FCH/4]|uniref:Surface antigen n=1 Tax=Plasmodium falciparum FCH/4 TaxID=1036724 RepID=A0A024VQG1_PLAFA|nr:hypothetical protein PFFCH_01579 [Plasmodium falciparum FCH/4]